MSTTPGTKEDLNFNRIVSQQFDRVRENLARMASVRQRSMREQMTFESITTRAREAQALGFKRIVMPSSNTSGLEKLLGLRVVGVRSVEEALGELF